MHYVYIIYSAKLDRYYIGESEDSETRLDFHNGGFQRYSKRACDWELVFKGQHASRTEAQKVERKIKSSKSRKTVKRWISGADNLMQ
ncbi:MAG: GIY-YIG nuclease family protein [Verrucomicrobiota bacterium]